MLSDLISFTGLAPSLAPASSTFSLLSLLDCIIKPKSWRKATLLLLLRAIHKLSSIFKCATYQHYIEKATSKSRNYAFQWVLLFLDRHSQHIRKERKGEAQSKLARSLRRGKESQGPQGYRDLAGVLLAALFWKLESAYNVRTKVRRLFEGRAVIKSSDDSHTWIMHFLKAHPKFQGSSKDVEVSTEPRIIEKLCDKKGDNMPLRQGQQRPYTQSYQTKNADGVKLTNKDTKARRQKVDLKPALSDSKHFMFQSTPFWIKKERQDERYGCARERLTITYWSMSSAPLEQLLDHAQDVYKASLKKTKTKAPVPIYRLSPGGSWKTPSYAKNRSKDTLHLPTELKQEIFSDASNFFSKRGIARYQERCVPHRRGMLFFGPPGSGKSTLAHVLASELGESMFVLDLGSSTIDDDNFLTAMKNLPSRCIVLIEDIDVAFVKRKKETKSGGDADGEQKKVKKPGVSFSAVLNALDGVDAAEGRLVLITTNHVEKLDSALVRPGRVDKKFEIKNAAKEEMRELFIRWFTLKSAKPTEEILLQAETFAQSVPEFKFSVAALQGYLLTCDEDSDKAAQGIEAWVREQVTEER